MTKDFYVFRHGQSTYNLAGRTQGQTNDSVLTPLGEEQALSIGQKLQDKGVELIATSPLQRAVQTATLANQSLKVPLVTDNDFIEVNVGVVEGMHYTEILNRYREIFEKLHSPHEGEGFDVCYPQGETQRQVRQRIWAGLNRWANDNKYKTIAISSHGIAITQIMGALNTPSQDVKNGAILHLRKDNDQWQIIEMI
ncbi:MAG: histidine phosphatase family protein [Alphaproteobacteria bacterium]|nr:histidine phosphatase family protein [Alphaproteobacteria bacterium]MBQ9235469.1 histidine phosphatase family protein [Alphaproteobacteria bacterium]